MKLIGGDSGRYEHETFVDEVLLAPSERATVDVLFDTAGDIPFEHRTPDRVYELGRFAVAGTATGDAAGLFATLRTAPELGTVRQALGPDLERPPDNILALSSLMPLLWRRGRRRPAPVMAAAPNPRPSLPPVAPGDHPARGAPAPSRRRCVPLWRVGTGMPSAAQGCHPPSRSGPYGGGCEQGRVAMAGGDSNADQYLTAGEVAEILQVSPKTVSRWADKGLIRCMVTLGGHRRFQRTLVEEIREEMYGPTSDLTNGGDAE